MKISRVEIENFRNFENISVPFGENVVIVGENKVGKSNFLYALRLVLDPSLPDSARVLNESDFWYSLPRPLTRGSFIRISIDISEFEDDEDLMAVLAEHIVTATPMTSRLTYLFRPLPTLEKAPSSDSDFEFLVYGGTNEENRIGYDLRRRIPLDVLPALRDAEGDLSTWRKSPLRPLIEHVKANIDRELLNDIATEVKNATSAVGAIPEVAELSIDINGRLEQMVGTTQAMNIALGFSPTDAEQLLRSIRLLIDEGRRPIGDASLGSMNVLYLVLKALEIRQAVSKNTRDHTVWAIEEPEAHLHPQLQRLVYRDFLNTRVHRQEENGSFLQDSTILLTTHSPHIVSVAPLRSLVLLQQEGEKTQVVSTADIDLSDYECADLERYLDVTRAEMLFARGVLLVEGDAEEYVIPVLARLAGTDLDLRGITVCSVSGTNFVPYVKLLNKLSIPFAVLTDFDPQEDAEPLGHNRVLKIMEYLMDPLDYELFDEINILETAPGYGVFLNSHTFEIDLFKSGRHESMCVTLKELTDNRKMKARADGWKATPSDLDEEQFLKDISSIGKGRFAQRLASRLTNDICPQYIREALQFVSARC